MFFKPQNRAHQAPVAKALNTLSFKLMVNPGALAGGDVSTARGTEQLLPYWFGATTFWR